MGFSGNLEDLDVDLRTPFFCTICGENIDYKDEVFAITIAVAQMTERGVIYSPLLFEDGDFLYEPHFLCFSCCEEALDELKDLVRDVPPIEDNYSILDCAHCKSGIRHGEVLAIVTVGEIQRSKRSPNGVNGGTTFVVTEDESIVTCICCINRLSHDVVDELWKEPVKQFHECDEGTQIRCWRSECNADESSDCANCKILVG